jgi:hypothetical protein
MNKNLIENGLIIREKNHNRRIKMTLYLGRERSRSWDP